MKKWMFGILIALLALSMIVTMTGCPNGDSPPPGPDVPDGEEITLGGFTVTNPGSEDTQAGWATNGVDGVDSDLTAEELTAAKYLVLELGNAPTGGMQIIWQGDGNNWAWTQTDGILNDDGTPNAANGASLEGKTLKIELSKAVKDYDKFLDSNEIKIFIAYYSDGGIASLDIKDAYLFIEAEEEEGEGDLKITFIAYEGAEPIIVTLDESQKFSDTKTKRIPANPTQEGFKFNRWEDAGGAEVTEDSSFVVDTTVVGTWWTTTLTDTGDALEKLMLENGSYAIYEFDVSGIAIGDITGLEVDYKVSEAAINTGVRNLRLMGPYIYSEFITQIDGSVAHFGDFAYDPLGAPTARYIAGATAADYNRDKNGPYINSNLNGANWAGSIPAAFGDDYDIQPNEWFTATYTFSQSFFTGTTVANILGTGNVRVATDDTDKIYFGIGMPTSGVNDGGIVQLVKNVKLTTTSGPVDGAIPDFDGDGKGDQAFASYFDPIQFNWRGPAADPVVRPTAPAAVTYPVAVPPASEFGESEPDTEGNVTGYFYVNLADHETVTTVTAWNIVDTPVPTTFVKGTGNGITTGTLTANFTQQYQRLNIGLFPDQIDALRDAGGEITITIDGSADPDNEFRYHLADPFAGGSWNATNGSGNAAFSTILSSEQGFNAGNKSRATLSYLVLNYYQAGNTTVTINSIKIEYGIPAIVLAPAATEDFVFYKSVSDGGSDPAAKNASAINSNWYDLPELDAVGPIEFPEGLDISSYKHFTIKAKFTKADGTVLVPGEDGVSKQLGQVKIAGLDHYNLGEENAADNQCTVNAPVLVARRGKHVGLIGESELTLQFQGRNNWETAGLAFIELLEITFLKD